jgi:hypothetical protein
VVLIVLRLTPAEGNAIPADPAHVIALRVLE